jgi:ATP phosphoribosyltransferase
MARNDIRLALPSKGRLAEDALEFLDACGLKVYRPNPRQYAATIPALPGLTIMFQRPGDIAVGVRQGSVDLGITGYDVYAEKQASLAPEAASGVLLLHDALGFSPCYLALAVPEAWEAVARVADLARLAQWTQAEEGRALRVATRFPQLTARFLEDRGITPFELVEVEGTLEIAPAVGYADLIADLVSTGTTLRDNHLRELEDGTILHSQAILIGNRAALQQRPDVLELARELIEYVEAHLRAEDCYLVFANMRGDSADEIARRMFAHPELGGLQGPTIAPIVPNNRAANDAASWYAVNLVVRKERLTPTIAALRATGGSGVVVTPVTYIFEEEPARYRAMLAALEEEAVHATNL